MVQYMVSCNYADYIEQNNTAVKIHSIEVSTVKSENLVLLFT